MRETALDGTRWMRHTADDAKLANGEWPKKDRAAWAAATERVTEAVPMHHPCDNCLVLVFMGARYEN